MHIDPAVAAIAQVRSEACVLAGVGEPRVEVVERGNVGRHASPKCLDQRVVDVERRLFLIRPELGIEPGEAFGVVRRRCASLQSAMNVTP